ncbi:hypothetical protein O181_093620 [Austropuccinia psidii MF-1]|uniref:Uncharacterized protein n=1 Tax=Austropuccinia psidii MF-1 TaxID=1389203 RepID=A0A9Q3J0L6_9BASI|nr:hypothetical protein [Austropuccinia psidii MF-1]
MSCTLCTKWGTPASTFQQQPTPVMLADKHTRNSCLFSDPSNHASRGVRNQDALVRTPVWSTMMKAFPSGNGRRERFRTISPVPSSIDLSTPLLGHHPMVTSLLNQSEVIIQPMKDGNGKTTFELGPIFTHGIQMPNLPHGQNLWQPTPGLSGTQWLEDLFHSKQPKFHSISTFNSSELTLPPFVEPSRSNEPPILGPSPSSEPKEDVPTYPPSPCVPSPSAPTLVPSPEIPPIAPKNPTASSPRAKLPSFPE